MQLAIVANRSCLNELADSLNNCGSGIGMAMCANRFKKIRAAVCYNVKSTKLSRSHNNANIIAIGSRLTNKNLALKLLMIFLKTKFDGGRHKRRTNKI